MYDGNGLCESVTANDDASEFTLKLKDGLKWHDGQPITADDVVFTMQVLVDGSRMFRILLTDTLMTRQ